MSVPSTGYICENAAGVYQDLSAIFQPLNGGTSAGVTGFDVSGNDLNTIFLAASAGNYIDFSTNYIVNGVDLAQIFAPYNPAAYTTTGGPTITTSANYTFVTFAGNGTITFATQTPVTVNYLLVGGGGSGGAGGGVYTGNGWYYCCGGGGASGAILQSSVSVSQNYSCTITVGSGGACVYTPTTSAPSSGNPSAFQYSSDSSVNAIGGNYGYSGTLSFPSANVTAAGGTSTYGNGGEGDMMYYPANGTGYYVFAGLAGDAGGYNINYSNITVDGINLGTFGGGGGGGTIFGNEGGISGLVQDSSSSLYYYPGQGSGSGGGSVNMGGSNSYIGPFVATNGGGGGGGTFTFPGGSNSIYTMAGASGGNGAAILWFSNNIS